VTETLAERLAAATLGLVDVPSESLHEAALTDLLRDQGATSDGFAVADDLDSVLLFLPAGRRRGAPLVLFAGHTDTVPIAGNVPGRLDAEAIVGRGACDMKAGLAVMLELMRSLSSGGLASDLDAGFLFFGREEVSSDRSALLPLFERRSDLGETALAVVMEPTDNAVEVGCLGNLDARVTIDGVAAHSARPWLGDNAIHRAVAALEPIARLPVLDVELDGLVFREVVNVTEIEGGVAANVLPDRVVATVNYRYAPNRSPDQAESFLRALLDDANLHVEVRNNARPGPVTVRNPLVERLRAAGDLPVRPKQAWTPVAEFAEAGIDAVNCGPGDPQYAHKDDERVERAALVRSFEVLSRFLTSGA